MFFLILTLCVATIMILFGRSIRALYYDFFPAQRNTTIASRDEFLEYSRRRCKRREVSDHQDAINRKKLIQDREALELEMDLTHEERMRNIAASVNRFSDIKDSPHNDRKRTRDSTTETVIDNNAPLITNYHNS